MLACCRVVMCKAASRHCWQDIIAEQGGLRRRTIPEHSGAIGMHAFIYTAMFPAHNKMAIKRYTVGDQEAVERSAVAIGAGRQSGGLRRIVDTARQAAQGQ